jgi:hypothetical protein
LKEFTTSGLESATFRLVALRYHVLSPNNLPSCCTNLELRRLQRVRNVCNVLFLPRLYCCVDPNIAHAAALHLPFRRRTSNSKALSECILGGLAVIGYHILRWRCVAVNICDKQQSLLRDSRRKLCVVRAVRAALR